MTSPNPAPALEAREAAYADWYVLQDAAQVDARAGWDAGWAAALAWAAQLAKQHNARYRKPIYTPVATIPPTVNLELVSAPFASLLRQEGGGT